MAKAKDSKKNIRRILSSTLFSILLIVICFVICHKVILSSYHYTEGVVMAEAQRTKDTNVTKAEIDVTDQTTLKDIANCLYKSGIITDERFFILESKLDDSNPHFIPGHYTISSNMSSTAIIELLTTSMNDEKNTIKFTIPEGYTVEQIAEALAAKNIVTKQEFLDAVSNRSYASQYAFLRDIPENGKYKYKLEGYLFPDTYLIRKDCSAEEIVVKMLDRFNAVYSKYSSYAHNSGYNTHSLLTIASIIEQEAKLDDERAAISGVIYNRLRAGMRLQMCSTVQYSLNKRKSSLTYADLKTDSPYNTYLYDGLPIGPICNPGEACIKAALFPDNNHYFYFVLKDNESGRHAFSETAEEHNREKLLYNESNDINFSD